MRDSDLMTQELSPQAPAARPVTPGQLAWLESELAQWLASGVLDDTQAQSIRKRYVAARRFSLMKLLLFVGGGFVGVGLLWLVASNLNGLSPLLRFAVVTLVWLGFVAAAEVLAGRREDRSGAGSGGVGPVVGTIRLIAALTFGAVVFQAAQSLQVPAYEPSLLGFWALGALLYAYAVGGASPLVVAITAGTGWFVWEVAEQAQDGMGFVLPVLLAAAVAGSVAVIHAGDRLPAFSASWREASAVLALLGLFAAAFPEVDLDGFEMSAPVVVAVVVALLAAAGAVLLGRGRARWEALMPLAAVGVGVLLVLWSPALPNGGEVSGEAYAHAAVSVAVYVLAAGWYAALGVWRDSGRLTIVATAALVLFTTVQSFAVFAPIVTGATLFLVLGATFLGGGYLVDRGRRHLVRNLEGAAA